VSAELWGRHFYAGEPLPVRFCVVNDREDGRALEPLTLEWQLVADNGTTLSSGRTEVPAVAHYGRVWVTPAIAVPEGLPTGRTGAKLVLRLVGQGQVVSANEYQLLLAKKEWSAAAASGRRCVLVDFSQMKAAFDFLKIPYTSAASVSAALALKASCYVFAGLDPDKNCTAQELAQIRAFAGAGGKVLLLDGPAAAKALYPEYIRGWIVPTEGDIVNMEIPESPVFNGIGRLELRYFNNNQREVPTVCHAALQVNRSPKLEALAMQMKIHGYVQGDMAQRAAYMESIKGFPLVKIKDGGTVTFSTMSLEKAVADPIAGKLLSNLIDDLLASASE
jgi:beta-galactosidase